MKNDLSQFGCKCSSPITTLILRSHEVTLYGNSTDKDHVAAVADYGGLTGIVRAPHHLGGPQTLSWQKGYYVNNTQYAVKDTIANWN